MVKNPMNTSSPPPTPHPALRASEKAREQQRRSWPCAHQKTCPPLDINWLLLTPATQLVRHDA